MNGDAVTLTTVVSARIAGAAIEEFPFPHIVVDELLPPAIYAEILREIPARPEFDVVEYPGTGFGRRERNYHDFGYAYRRMANAQGTLGALHAAFASDAIASALLEKFGNHALAIPRDKHRFFADGVDEFTTVFDLQIDLPGYAIPPHADIASKIVTFQLSLAEDDALAPYGTCLCIPDDPRVYKTRTGLERAVGRALSRLPRGNPYFRRLERSSFGLRFGVGDTANWLPWEWFKIAKVVGGLPNQFVAFAPNDRSFHAVDFSAPPDSSSQERKVLRGFIRSGKETKNWMRPHAAPPRPRLEVSNAGRGS